MPHDVSELPEGLRATARIDPNGEVSWPQSSATTAVEGLADAGYVVLGLDLRFYAADGRFYEIPFSSFEPDVAQGVAANADAGRRAAILALAKVDAVEIPADTVERRVLVTWR